MAYPTIDCLTRALALGVFGVAPGTHAPGGGVEDSSYEVI